MQKLVLIPFVLLAVASFGQDLHHIADSIRFHRRVPALVYAVVSADSVYIMGAVGYKRIRSKDTINVSNRFHLGSATSTFTSFIAAQLVGRGDDSTYASPVGLSNISRFHFTSA